MKHIKTKSHKSILIIALYVVLMIGAINFSKMPTTNAYFLKAEETSFAYNASLYKVEAVGVTINERTSNKTANITLDNIYSTKKYAITCGNSIINKKFEATTSTSATLDIKCVTDTSINETEEIEVKIYEIIETKDLEGKKVAEKFLCGSSKEKGVEDPLYSTLVQKLASREDLFANIDEVKKYLTYNDITPYRITEENVALIGIEKSGDIFNFDTNFEGYLQTYKNYNSTTPEKTKMYFILDSNDNKNNTTLEFKLQKALKHYLNKYIYPNNSIKAQATYDYILQVLKTINLYEIINESKSIEILKKENNYITLNFNSMEMEFINEIVEYKKILNKELDDKNYPQSIVEYLKEVIPTVATNPIYLDIVQGTQNNYIYGTDPTDFSIIKINDPSKGNISIIPLDKEIKNSTVPSELMAYITENKQTFTDKLNTYLANISIDCSASLTLVGEKGDFSLYIVTINTINNADNYLQKNTPTIEAYKKFIMSLDKYEKYNEDYPKTIDFILSDNIFYNNYKDQNPTKINYVYYEIPKITADEDEIEAVLEGETATPNNNAPIIPNLITMEPNEENKFTFTIINLEEVEDQEIITLVKEGLKVHYTVNDDKEKLKDIINNILDGKIISETTPKYKITDNDTDTITYTLNIEKPTTPETSEQFNQYKNLLSTIDASKNYSTNYSNSYKLVANENESENKFYQKIKNATSTTINYVYFEGENPIVPTLITMEKTSEDNITLDIINLESLTKYKLIPLLDKGLKVNYNDTTERTNLIKVIDDFLTQTLNTEENPENITYILDYIEDKDEIGTLIYTYKIEVQKDDDDEQVEESDDKVLEDNTTLTSEEYTKEETTIENTTKKEEAASLSENTQEDLITSTPNEVVPETSPAPAEPATEAPASTPSPVEAPSTTTYDITPTSTINLS